MMMLGARFQDPADGPRGAGREERVGGYLHPLYAEALCGVGPPLPLPASGGMLLVRPIAGSRFQDAVGCYPLFACTDWKGLRDDLEGLEGELVSVAMVADPFGDHDEALLRRCFPDVCFAYKDHYVIDLRRASGGFVSNHHARNVRKAMRRVHVELCETPESHVDEWVELYSHLMSLRQIRGVAAFSRDSLERQLQVPGLVMLRALGDGDTVGMILWYVQGEVGYYHLAAYSPTGYRLGASFALFTASIDYFRLRLRWLSLGGGAGVHASQGDSLARFKSGWATGVLTAYFCGRILHRSRYEALAARLGCPEANYFPIYRRGEIS